MPWLLIYGSETLYYLIGHLPIFLLEQNQIFLLINIISNKSGYIYIIHIIIHIYYNHDEYIKNQEFNHFQYMHVHMNSHLLYTIITIITIIMIVIIIYYCYSLLLFFK